MDAVEFILAVIGGTVIVLGAVAFVIFVLDFLPRDVRLLEARVDALERRNKRAVR
jgi:hypothetical protein